MASNNWYFFYQNLNGKSRGITILWQRDLVTFMGLATLDQLVLERLSMGHHKKLIVATIYANNDHTLRR